MLSNSSVETASMVSDRFQAVNPATGALLPDTFQDATSAEIDRAVQAADVAFVTFRKTSGAERARLLERIAQELDADSAQIIDRAHLETALPVARLTGELGRTTGQLRLFARYVAEGSWVDARLDTPLPDRQPLPRPDLRQMLRPLGPVAVFGASNFPLAFSVPGGDVASALAAGCPVVVKAHPAHPGTSALAGEAIRRAVAACGLPEGVFAMVQGRSTAVGQALVQHPLIKAVGFTGSGRGGRALFDLAGQRPEPIPVYAEMGSTNPVFFLPNILKERSESLAAAYVQSVTLGVGQFCTNPGLAILPNTPEAATFAETAGRAIQNVAPAPMLTAAIAEAFGRGIDHLTTLPGVNVLGKAEGDAINATLLTAPAATLLNNPALAEEVFGPGSVLLRSESREELLNVARQLHGHLTATVWGTDDELLDYADLLELLEQRVGRLVINGFPTGVEVSHAMHHGGPCPATTDSRSTSVGTNAIRRWARPVCYQNVPNALLPDELKDGNPLGLWRLVDGNLSRD